MDTKIEVRFTQWVYVNDTRFFGPGRLELLQLIEKTGSIAKAAKEMDMSYKKAWGMVTDLNATGKSAYVVAKKGGSKGGGAELTERAKEVIANYRELTEKIKKLVESENKLIESI